MDLQPPQATFTEGLGLGEEEESTRKIVADVVQVWRDRVCSATEVHIVGEVELITQELQLDSQRVGAEGKGVEGRKQLTARAISIL
jgi:hypothetical protein